MMMLQCFLFFFYLLLVVVFQLCIQKVQSDGLPEVNDLKKREKAGEDEGGGLTTVRRNNIQI